MINFLKPLYESLSQEPQTLNEVAFYQGFKGELLEAWEWCEWYKLYGEEMDMNQAWEIYFSIF